MNGKTQLNDAAIRMREMSALSERKFKAAIIKMLLYTIINYLETNGKKKTRKCDEKIEGIINKPDVNYVKKYTNKNFETCWICSAVELR